MDVCLLVNKAKEGEMTYNKINSQITLLNVNVYYVKGINHNIKLNNDLSPNYHKSIVL